jgi:hypothetical protein
VEYLEKYAKENAETGLDHCSEESLCQFTQTKLAWRGIQLAIGKELLKGNLLQND